MGSGGLRKDVCIIGKVCEDYALSREEQIYKFIEDNPHIGNEFIIIDDETIDMTPFGYNNEDHFIQCTTNAGFGMEEFDLAKSKVEKLLNSL